MEKPRYYRSFSAVLALLIIASLMPFASCGGTNGADKGTEPGVSQAAASAEEAQAQLAQDRQPAPPSPQEEAISALQEAGSTASALAADPARAATDTEALKASVAANTAKLTDTVTQTADKLTELGLEGKQERFE